MVITYYCIVTLFIMAYLLGSIPSAVWIGTKYYGVDVREHGSKNAGTTNVLRVLGLRAALPVFAIDFLKGFVAVSIFQLLKYDDNIPSQAWIINMKILAVFVVTLGHIFPIFAKFKGGKGVLSTATMVLILSPIPFAVLILLFIGLVAWTKYVSLGSVASAVLYPVALHATFNMIGCLQAGLISLSSIIIAILIVWCHRGNLERISNRTENKISFGKKKAEPEEDDDDEE